MQVGISGRKLPKGRDIREETAYKYFIRTSRASGPPSEPYILLSIGDISDCLIDCNVSTTVARCTSCSHDERSIPTLFVLFHIGKTRSPLHLVASYGGVGCLPLPARPLHTAHSRELPLTHPLSLPLLITALFDWIACALLMLRLREWRGGGRRCRSWRGIRDRVGQRLWCANSLLP